jgi:hypothetical protein
MTRHRDRPVDEVGQVAALHVANCGRNGRAVIEVRAARNKTRAASLATVAEEYRQLGIFAVKTLFGNWPVQQPPKFEFVINLGGQNAEAELAARLARHRRRGSLSKLEVPSLQHLAAPAHGRLWHTAWNRSGAKVRTRSERSGHGESVGSGLI